MKLQNMIDDGIRQGVYSLKWFEETSRFSLSKFQMQVQ